MSDLDRSKHVLEVMFPWGLPKSQYQNAIDLLGIIGRISIADNQVEEIMTADESREPRRGDDSYLEPVSAKDIKILASKPLEKAIVKAQSKTNNIPATRARLVSMVLRRA